ncbi:hypothetical protein RM533_13375 [Croceicoccus sp. F390]|uniref:Transposase n=1 Tax=Croceicoccus esteveae TaxID=3075597 RepID=A0ABU2ZLB2_9SPHN|nr:hypothetical protein [Croceicoccus sp. F390]MDT0577156.1 hypothetical protein [Croceicoccus sp. F390]
MTDDTRRITSIEIEISRQEADNRDTVQRMARIETKLDLMVAAIGRAGPSQTMRGYWQRRKANDNGLDSNDNAPEAEVVDLLTGRKGSSSGAR